MYINSVLKIRFCYWMNFQKICATIASPNVIFGYGKYSTYLRVHRLIEIRLNAMSLRGSLGKRLSITAKIQSKVAAETHPEMNDDNTLQQVSAIELQRPFGTFVADTTSRVLVTKVQKPWYIILPKSKLRVAWDTLMVFVLSTFILYIPFRLCFYWERDSAPFVMLWIEHCTDILFVIDILLNFFTAFEDPIKNENVVDLSSIAKRYLKGFFLFDLVATFPFQWVILNSSVTVANNLSKLGKLPKLIKAFKAIKLLKLLKAYKFSLLITKLELDYNVHHGITKLISNIIVMLLITHVSGCFWYLVGVAGGNDSVNGGWIYRYNYSTKTTGVQYVASLYWAFSSLTSVGYGDIVGKTVPEQLYSMLIMLIGATFYGFIVSSMTSIMTSFDAQNKAVRDKIIHINEFIRATKLPPALARQVRSYFEFKISHTQKAFFATKNYDAQELLLQMSSGLRSDILLFLEKDLVENIDFFKNKDPQFVADVVSVIQPIVAREGEHIIKEGSRADEMYFLSKGTVVVRFKSEIVLELNQGSFFGEVECILGERIRSSTVIAMSDCELHVLLRRDLLALIAEYPEVGEELKIMALDRIAHGNHQRGSANPHFSNSNGENNFVYTDNRDSLKEALKPETAGIVLAYEKEFP